jgi:hypothetical protein
MSAPRILQVVVNDENPRHHIAELLNNLDEAEERALLAYLRSDEFAAFAVCREVEMDADLGEEWFA